MTRKIVLCTILILSVLANGSAFARKKITVDDDDEKVVRIKKRDHHADKVIIVRDRCPNKVIVEKRVIVREVVERPVIVREVVEKPVIVRKVVERSVIVREVVESPVIVREYHPVVMNRPVAVPAVSCATLGFSAPVRIGGILATVSFSSTSCSTHNFED